MPKKKPIAKKKTPHLGTLDFNPQYTNPWGITTPEDLLDLAEQITKLPGLHEDVIEMPLSKLPVADMFAGYPPCQHHSPKKGSKGLKKQIENMTAAVEVKLGQFVGAQDLVQKQDRASMSFELAVCITTWNSEATIVKALDVIFKDLDELQDYQTEVRIFDQASTDSTPELIKEYAKTRSNLCIHFCEKNLGQSISRNSLRKHRGPAKYVMYLDGDIVPIPGSIVAMWETLNAVASIQVLWYDIRGDTHDAEKATPAEVALLPSDLEQCNQVMFHYAMYRKELADRASLPEFYPFCEPGWGVEEDVAWAIAVEKNKAAGKPAPTGCMAIKHRKFYHHAAGQSVNSMGQLEWVMTRARRWFAWQVFLRMEDVSKMAFIDNPELDFFIKTRFVWAPLKRPSWTRDLMMAIFKMLTPFQFQEEHKPGTIWLFVEGEELDESVVKIKKDKLVMIPRKYSPVWLAAHLPQALFDTTESAIPWMLFGSAAEKLKTLEEFALSSAKYNSVHVDDPDWMLACALLGLPCELNVEYHKLHASEQILVDCGMRSEMTAEQSLAFRQTQQRACARHIIPLVEILGDNGQSYKAFQKL